MYCNNSYVVSAPTNKRPRMSPEKVECTTSRNLIFIDQKSTSESENDKQINSNNGLF